MLKKLWQISAVMVMVVCALTVVGCRSMTGRSFGQHIDDKTISTQVKTKLTGDKFVNLFSTGVGTHYGVVRLSGTVGTPEDRAEAERIAGRVKGVKGVVNDILVVPRDGRMAGTPAGPSPAASPGTTSTTGTTR
jgi:osmotically-inducible protein OsmY